MDAIWPGTLTAAVLVCTRPRATIRAIVDSDPGRHVVPLVVLVGLVGGLGPGHPRPWGAVGAVVLAVVAVPVVYGIAWAFAAVGRAFGGTGDAVGVRAALAWSGMPVVFAFGVRLLAAAIFGSAALEDGFVAQVATQFARLATAWVWILGLATLAEVHRFSLLRAFATTFVGSIVFAVPVVVVGVVVALVAMALGGGPGRLLEALPNVSW